MSNRARVAFIDFLKFAGITVIVYGHVAAWAPLATFPPVYLKQFGVAFFLFGAGFTLADETRPSRDVLFNRLFDVYAYGIALALLVSVLGLIIDGGSRKSNFLPFFGGINVVLNNFPANPTTWYVGTYIHVLVLWAICLRRWRISLTGLCLAFLFELVVRALLLEYAGVYVAYMMFPNWTTVFVTGLFFGQRRIVSAPARPIVWFAALLLTGAGWLWAVSFVPLRDDFPFAEVAVGPPLVRALATSALVSVIYITTTLLAFAACSGLRDRAPVRFIARNTLVIFLAHMPVYFVALAWLPERLGAVRSLIMMVICLPGLALLSEALRRTGWSVRLRHAVAERVTKSDPRVETLRA